MIVSQFTLYGDARKGRRPGFTEAASGETANSLYENVCSRVESYGIQVERGKFGADMKVALVNDGPVTLLLDSRKQF
jgi:D-aminoacyl-tRNA deacylase